MKSTNQTDLENIITCLNVHVYTQREMFDLKKTAFFSSFFLSSSSTRLAFTPKYQYTRNTHRTDRLVSPKCLLIVYMIRDNVCSRRTERWSSTLAWRAPCFIYVGWETGAGARTVVFLFEGQRTVKRSRACPRCQRTVSRCTLEGLPEMSKNSE